MEVPKQGPNAGATIDITARGCEPQAIYAALSQRESTLFAVRFENCELGRMNLTNCCLVNVMFQDCKFGGPTAWANVALSDMEFINCDFRNHFWTNGRMAGTIEVNKTFPTDLDETKRREISDIEWLQQGAGAVRRGHAVASAMDPLLVVPR